MRKLITVCVVLLIVFLPVRSSSDWDHRIIEEGIGEGQWNSIAVDQNDIPCISYYSYGGEFDLKYSYWNGSDWIYTIVDSTGVVGKYSSLVFDSNNYPSISYYDDTNDDLKYAKWTGSNWNIEPVDSTDSVGEHTSMDLDSNGYPHISYHDDTNDALKYARWNGSDWEIETIEPNVTLSSLCVDSNDRAHITYEYGGVLTYAKWTGSEWNKTMVSDPSDAIAARTSLALNSNDHPHITYRLLFSWGLKYVFWDGSSWNASEPDFFSIGYDSSICLDNNDSPHTTCYDSTPDGLRYVNWTGAFWTSQIVHISNDVGFGASIDVDSNGDPHIIHYNGNTLEMEYVYGTGIAQLYCTGETGYISDGVEPDTALQGETFTFRVKYVDTDNDSPFVVPKVHILRSGVEIAESPFTMSEADPSDTTYSDGKLYTADVSLGTYAGTDYGYYFLTNDSNGNTVHTSIIEGPNVQCYISGSVTLDGEPLPGIFIELEQLKNYFTWIATTTSDDSGNYSFSDLSANETYKVIPADSDYYFSPSDHYYSKIDQSDNAADFTSSIKKWYIRGNIEYNASNPIEGVQVNLSGDSTGSTLTDASGNFEFNNLITGCSFVVTPVKDGHIFNPTETSYSNLRENVAVCDFRGYKVWSMGGFVTDGEKPIEGVLITIDGAASGTTTTDSNGEYQFDDLKDGFHYTLVASHNRYEFAPSIRDYYPLTDDITDAHFTGTLVFPNTLRNVKVFPNPVIQSESNEVIFQDLMENCTISLYTVAGDHLVTMDNESIDHTWKVENTRNEKLATGIYIYIIIDEDGEQCSGKLAVIR